jgi:hypothetical protein
MLLKIIVGVALRGHPNRLQVIGGINLGEGRLLTVG